MNPITSLRSVGTRLLSQTLLQQKHSASTSPAREVSSPSSWVKVWLSAEAFVCAREASLQLTSDLETPDPSVASAAKAGNSGDPMRAFEHRIIAVINEQSGSEMARSKHTIEHMGRADPMVCRLWMERLEGGGAPRDDKASEPAAAPSAADIECMASILRELAKSVGVLDSGDSMEGASEASLSVLRAIISMSLW